MKKPDNSKLNKRYFRPALRTVIILLVVSVFCFGAWIIVAIKHQRSNNELILAIYHGDSRSAIELLSAGASGDAYDSGSQDGFHAFMDEMKFRWNNHLYGVSAQRRNSNKLTAIVILFRTAAARKSAEVTAFPDPELVRALVKHGANVNSSDSTGSTPLLFAVQMGNVKIVDLLLASGANVNATTKEGSTALSFALDDIDVVTTLLKHGALTTWRSPDGETPLILASQMHDVMLVKLLLKYGVDISANDFQGHDALYWSVRYPDERDGSVRDELRSWKLSHSSER